MLTYAHVCSRMLTYAHVCSRMLTYAHICSRMRRQSWCGITRCRSSQASRSGRAPPTPTTHPHTRRPPTHRRRTRLTLGPRTHISLLTYAHVCSCMLTYAHVCSRMTTYDHVCWPMLAYSHVCLRILAYAKYADACGRMLAYAIGADKSEEGPPRAFPPAPLQAKERP
jgi:hypothetical protein